MAKTIGIPGYNINTSGSSPSFGVAHTYAEFARSFGNLRIISPEEEKVEVDLLILPGGLDLSPTAYGAVPNMYTSNQDVFKQFFFEQRLKNYVGNTPIFGICLGFQMLNVYFGGTLKQHLKYHPQSIDRWRTAHHVIGKPGSAGPNLCTVFQVNSHHHQGVTKKNLSKDLDPLLWHYVPKSKDIEGYKHPDGIIEGFKHKELPIAGVQYHPEELYDEFSENLINELIEG